METARLESTLALRYIQLSQTGNLRVVLCGQFRIRHCRICFVHRVQVDARCSIVKSFCYVIGDPSTRLVVTVSCGGRLSVHLESRLESV